MIINGILLSINSINCESFTVFYLIIYIESLREGQGETMDPLKEAQLNQALVIINSNIANCRKFQVKFIEGSSNSKRLSSLSSTMKLCLELIQKELSL
jgi:hypothetical protein